MSQITRCPACATLFKVVADQLKVAQGWVRCGQCGEVFEAGLHLVPVATLETQASPSALKGLADETPLPAKNALPFPMSDHGVFPPPVSPKVPAGVPLMSPEASCKGNLADAAADDKPMQPADVSESENASGMPLPGENPAIGSRRAGSETSHFSATNAGRHEPVFRADDFDFNPPGSTLHATGHARQASAIPQDSQAFPDVAFVRKAQRKDFWKSTLVRTVLGAICLVLALALGMQWTVGQKDALAARAPQLAPWLQAMCRPLGCAVQPLRRIESLAIENTSFSRTGSDAYRLNFTFTNTGDAALEVPALEVTLTDSQDQTVVRRVVMPVEFGATATTLAAYSKLTGALTLKVDHAGGQASASPAQTGLLPVSGYRILAFYP